MKRPLLLAITLAVATLLTGCIGPGYPALTQSDAEHYVILESDVKSLSKLTDHEIVDFASIDGISSDKFTNHRIERDAHGKLTKVFILLEPKRYTLTLRYTKAMHRATTWEFLYGDVTYDYDLSPGFYGITARADDPFVNLFLRDSLGQRIGAEGKSVLRLAATPATYTPIPLIIK